MTQTDFIPNYSTEDYELWEGDWELWNGVPVAMSPSPSFRHQKISLEIASEIRIQLKEDPFDDGCSVVFETDWRVDDHTVVRPDVMVVCAEPKDEWVEDPPTLVVEVLSPSTRKKDLTVKKDLYAANEVKYYLMFDPQDNSTQFLELETGTYREISTDGQLDLSESCSVKLEIEEILEV